jgi:hypothetical protein
MNCDTKCSYECITQATELIRIHNAIRSIEKDIADTYSNANGGRQRDQLTDEYNKLDNQRDDLQMNYNYCIKNCLSQCNKGGSTRKRLYRSKNKSKRRRYQTRHIRYRRRVK